MATYAAYAIVSGSKYLGTVEADTPEEAREKVFEELTDAMSIILCHNCSEQIECPEVTEIEVHADE